MQQEVREPCEEPSGPAGGSKRLICLVAGSSLLIGMHSDWAYWKEINWHCFTNAERRHFDLKNWIHYWCSFRFKTASMALSQIFLAAHPGKQNQECAVNSLGVLLMIDIKWWFKSLSLFASQKMSIDKLLKQQWIPFWDIVWAAREIFQRISDMQFNVFS